MAEFDGLKAVGLTDQAFPSTARLIEFPQPNPPPQWQFETLSFGLLQALADDYKDGPSQFGAATALVTQRSGVIPTSLGDDVWWEHVHVFPRKIDAGLVLATSSFQLDLFNGYRTERRTLTAFVNNAGGGITITNLPTLPFTIEELKSLALTLNVLPDGPPKINGTLVFVTDTDDPSLLLTGERAILLAVEPVLPVIEVLEFLTDIVAKRTGKEQRISLRANPRQVLDLLYEVESFDRGFLEARIFGGQDRTYGMPVWWEASILAAPVSIGNITITVDSTAFADFRVGDLVIVFVGSDDHEVLDVQSFTATTITFASGFTKAFPIGVRVMPVRAVRIQPMIRGEKFPKNLQRTRLRATVLDNDVGLASTAVFPSFGGKVLLDEGNRIPGTLPESFDRRIEVVDSETGLQEATSYEPLSRRGSSKSFHVRTRQRLWEVRQLLHALRGRAISFYLPTFFDEFVLTQPITAASSTLTFKNVGFKDFVNAQLPRNIVRLVLLNGTKVIRTIVSAAEIDALTEQIVVDSPWGVNATIAEVDFVDFLEKVRADSDEIRIEHTSGRGDAIVEFPVKAVLE